MTDPGDLKVAAKGDFELVMTRSFNAPRHLVFEAFTKPELVKRWLLGPDGWSMPLCEIDLRVGGKYRYVWRRDKDGKEMAMGGVFREVMRPERTVATEAFDDPWYPGEAITTTVFTEQGGRTVVDQSMRFETKEARDGCLKSGMESGVAVSYNRLAVILAEQVAAAKA